MGSAIGTCKSVCSTKVSNVWLFTSFVAIQHDTVGFRREKIGPRRSEVADFVLNGVVAERGESYKYLGFVFHSTKTCLLEQAAWW